MTFTVTDCRVTKGTLTIIFSGPVDPASAAEPSNYTVFDPGSEDFTDPARLDASTIQSPISVDNDRVKIALTNSKQFQSGDWVSIVVTGVTAQDGTQLEDGSASIARQVPGKGKTGRITRDVEDAISYPILTEDVGSRPSPVGVPAGIGPAGSGPGVGLGQVAAKAVSEVLGWKPNSADPKGFVGALTQAFTLTDIEGHVESTWNPRTYAVQTDLGGGITGAQASLYARAKAALDSALPLLDGLYPLDVEADPEYVKALREMARSQMSEIVKELGIVGLPSVLRIDTYFGILLGQNPAELVASGDPVQFEPDQIKGTLGELRDTYGIYFAGNQFNNSVQDEQDITNFRVISDYMTSLMQSWISNRQFFFLRPDQQAFFGTQLVLISRQFTTIAETVNEVRFALDSVFIGPNERQTLLLQFTDTSLPPMFLETVLLEVEKFVLDEGNRLLRDGGKISVTNNILPVVQALVNMVEQAHVPENIDELPDGFKTARVRNSLDDLQDQLEALVALIEQVEQEPPEAEDKVIITKVTTQEPWGDGYRFSILGNGFVAVPDPVVNVYSSVVSPVEAKPEFVSSQRIDAFITGYDWDGLSSGWHDVVLTTNGQTVTATQALWKPDDSGSVPPYSPSPGSASTTRPKPRGGIPFSGKKRAVGIEISNLIAPSRSAAPAAAAAQQGGPSAHFDQLKDRVEQLHDNHKTLSEKLEQLHQSHSAVSQNLDEVMRKISKFFDNKESTKKDDQG